MPGTPTPDRPSASFSFSAAAAPLCRARLAPRIVCALLAVGAVLAAPLPPASAATASAASTAAAQPALDPVVGQVLQMLQGGVASPVIVAWLDKSGRRPASVESGDLVALHKAGASDELLRKLIDLAESSPAGASSGSASSSAPPPPPPAAAPAPAPAAPAASAPASPTAVPAPAPPPPVTSPAAVPAAPAPAAPSPHVVVTPTPAAPAVPVVPAGAGGAVTVHFAVTYRPVFAEGEEPWALFLYVDGRYLGSVQPGMVMIPLPPRTFDRLLDPGRHVLRVTQERHRRYSSIVGYLTPSRIDENEFVFVLQPSSPAQVKVHFGEKSLRHAGPVSVRIEQSGTQLLDVEPKAADAELWPALCEDITASLPAGAKLGGAARREMTRCVHWSALWTGLPAAPSRDEVRAEIDRQQREAENPTH